MNQIRYETVYPDYHKLSQSENKVRKISQPVKIAQLLNFPGQLQSCSKNPIVKIREPERIKQTTPYLKNITTQRKNNLTVKISQSERIKHDIPYLKSVTTQRKELNLINQFNVKGKVRQNLNFTETTKIIKVAKENETTSDLHDNRAINETNLYYFNRKSLLLPPNTIKDMHIRSRIKQNNLNELTKQDQTLILITDCGNNYSKKNRILEPSKSCFSLVEDAIIDPIYKNNKTSVIKYASSRLFNTNDQSDANNLYSSCVRATNAMTASNEQTTTPFKQVSEPLNSNISNINVHSIQDNNEDVITKEQLSSIYNAVNATEITLCDGNYVDLKENVICKLDNETIGELNINLQRDINKDLEHKRELTALESKLKHLICRFEEDTSFLKLMLTSVTDILSANKITSNNENKSEQHGTKSLNDKTEIEESINIKSPQYISIPDIYINNDNISEEVYKTPDLNLLKSSGTEVSNTKSNNNFEIQLPLQTGLVSENNDEITNLPNVAKFSEPKSKMKKCSSARIKAEIIKNSNETNDSFVDLENQLNIVNEKSNTTIISHRNSIAVTNECQNKKTERSWKEYMALKSRMSCLLTPVAKRKMCNSSENGVHFEVTNTKASLSNKVFAELCNLYADSPNTH